MRLRDTRNIFLISLLMLLIAFATIIIAADDERHQRHEGRHDGNNYNLATTLRPVSNATYADQCGACHFVYQPELLPAASWRKILEGIDNHFGEKVYLEEKARLEINSYLLSNAADKSFTGLAEKIVRCLGGVIPLRITEIPYIRLEHEEITQEILERKSVGSLSNCTSCHATAGKGVYDDKNVSIPKK